MWLRVSVEAGAITSPWTALSASLSGLGEAEPVFMTANTSTPTSPAASTPDPAAKPHGKGFFTGADLPRFMAAREVGWEER